MAQGEMRAEMVAPVAVEGVGNGSDTGKSGGSGVVILRAGQQAASTTGSPSETTSGSDYIYTFTGSGSITF